MLPILPPTLRAGTLDLPAVPRWLQLAIIAFLDAILAWAETRIMRRVLALSADHPLVQLALRYDPAAVVERDCGYAGGDGRRYRCGERYDLFERTGMESGRIVRGLGDYDG